MRQKKEKRKKNQDYVPDTRFVLRDLDEEEEGVTLL